MPRVIDKQPIFLGKKWMLMAVLFCLIDQVSKWLAVEMIPENGVKSIFTGLQFTLSYNRGVAFSLLNDQAEWGRSLLMLGIVIISFIIGRWLIRTPVDQKWEGYCLALIFGGAMGNLVDRLWHGSVIDFIDFYYRHYHWYNFNLADAFISIGAIMLIRTVLLKPNEERGV